MKVEVTSLSPFSGWSQPPGGSWPHPPYTEDLGKQWRGRRKLMEHLAHHPHPRAGAPRPPEPGSNQSRRPVGPCAGGMRFRLSVPRLLPPTVKAEGLRWGENVWGIQTGRRGLGPGASGASCGHWTLDSHIPGYSKDAVPLSLVSPQQGGRQCLVPLNAGGPCRERLGLVTRGAARDACPRHLPGVLLILINRRSPLPHLALLSTGLVGSGRHWTLEAQWP